MTPQITNRDFLKLWWQVALLSFGGPAAQISIMQRLVVDDRGWLDQARFNHALNFCLLLPGPEAQQLATYVGWLLKGVRGAVLAGAIFVLPGALVMLGLSVAYVSLGETPAINGVLFGLKCAVLAIVLQALTRMVGRVVQGAAAITLSVIAFVAMTILDAPFPLVLLLAAIAGAWCYSNEPIASIPPTPARPVNWRIPAVIFALWLAPLALLLLALGPEAFWTRLAAFFSAVAALSFGGAYAVLAWVAQFASEGQAWITPEQMLDGLGLAETTPGPLILVTQFVGFVAASNQAETLHPLVAGTLASVLVSWLVFVPSLLWILVLAPHVERLRQYAVMAGALRGITAAVVGIIASLALWFGVAVLFGQTRTLAWANLRIPWPVVDSLDPWALLISAAAAALLMLRGMPLWLLILVSALGGLLLSLLGLV